MLQGDEKEDRGQDVSVNTSMQILTEESCGSKYLNADLGSF